MRMAPMAPMATEAQQFLLLLNWMSPTFPIGSFAYSHGLEQVIADGRVTSARQVEDWISELLEHGSGWTDAVLFSLCWEEASEGLNEFALALAGSRERYLETTQLGRAFEAAAAAWTSSIPANEPIAYPVAAGRACMALGVPKQEALLAFIQAFCAAQVSVAVRLVPLGQSEGLNILRNLTATIMRTAGSAAGATRDDIGACTVAAEIAAMAHETLGPRIFRT